MNRLLCWFMAAVALAASGVNLYAQGPTDPNEGSKLEWDSTNSIYRFS